MNKDIQDKTKHTYQNILLKYFNMVQLYSINLNYIYTYIICSNIFKFQFFGWIFPWKHQESHVTPVRAVSPAEPEAPVASESQVWLRFFSHCFTIFFILSSEMFTLNHPKCRMFINFLIGCLFFKENPGHMVRPKPLIGEDVLERLAAGLRSDSVLTCALTLSPLSFASKRSFGASDWSGTPRIFFHPKPLKTFTSAAPQQVKTHRSF